MNDTTWDLAVALVPPPGTGPVLRAGAAEFVVAALDELDLEVDYYSPDEDPEVAGVVLVGVEPGGASQDELLARASGVIETLVATTPELAGWGQRVQITATEDDELAELEAAFLADDLPDELIESGVARGSVYEDAALFHAVPLEDLVVEDLAELPEAEQEAARRRATALAGCLIQGSIVVIDQLFADIEDLRTADDFDDDGDVSSTWVLSELPARFAVRFTPTFAQRFLVALADVTARFTTGWTPLACVAQEFALRILLNQVELTAEIAEAELADGWREHLEALWFTDLDHEMLYDPSLDGIEDDPSAQPPGMKPMRFEDWFTPFSEGLTLPPYALPG